MISGNVIWSIFFSNSSGLATFSARRVAGLLSLFFPLDYKFLCCSDCSIRWKHPFVTIPLRRAGWSAPGFTHFQKGDSTGLSINSMSVTLRERPDWRLLFQMPVSSRSTFAVWSLSVSGSCVLFFYLPRPLLCPCIFLHEDRTWKCLKIICLNQFVLPKLGRFQWFPRPLLIQNFPRITILIKVAGFEQDSCASNKDSALRRGKWNWLSHLFEPAIKFSPK